MNPLSAMIDILVSQFVGSFCMKPDTPVSYTSEIDPSGDTKQTAPLRVHPIKHLLVQGMSSLRSLIPFTPA